MQDLLWQIKDVDSFTVYTTAAFTAAVFWFIREIVAEPLLALMSVPFLMAGGIASPFIFQNMMLTVSYDKEANVAATTGIGVLAALVFILVIKWLFAVVTEYRVRRTQLTPLAETTPIGPLARLRRR